MAKPKGKHLASKKATGRKARRAEKRAEKLRVAEARGSASRRGRRQASAGRRRHRGAKVALGVLVALLATSGTAYAAGVHYFSTHFLPNTTVNGIDVSLKTADELAALIDEEGSRYTQTVTVGDFTTTLTADQIGFTTDGSAAAQAAMAQATQDLYRWPLEVAGSHSYISEAATSFDKDKLDAALSSAVDSYNETAESPQDASIIYSDEQGAFVINPEVAGSVVDKDAVSAQTADSVRSLSEQTDLGDDAVERPSVTSTTPELVAAVDKANRMLAVTVPLTRDGSTKATVDKDVIRGWITIGDDYEVSLDPDKVESYVSGVADRFASSDDTYSYTVKSAELARDIEGAVMGESSSAIEVPMSAKAKPRQVSSSMGTGTWDGTGAYLDVDLANQYARLYDASGSVTWESYVVTGNTSQGRNTPTGTFAIQSKEANVTLVGADEDKDGKPDYESHVSYWMPFYAGSYGLHDATWRSSFGGSIYQTGGSHGCVNLPYDKAAQLFDLVSVGTTVKIHS